MAKIARAIVALDSGAVIALARGDSKARGRTIQWMRDGAEFVVPAPVLTETLRGGKKDAGIHRAFNLVTASVVEMSVKAARRAGELLGSSGATSTHTVDAMIVATAIEHKATDILTTDPADIGLLSDGALEVIPL